MGALKEEVSETVRAAAKHRAAAASAQEELEQALNGEVR